MRRIAPALLGLLVLVQPDLVWAQDRDYRSLRCPGRGVAEPPAWYTKPRTPPPDAYQAEARSGGCADAEVAQQVAARLASWLLVYQKSPRAVLEEIELRRRALSEAGAWDRRRREFKVVERALARKVLTRSWVHRQETRWTGKGSAEHFLVVRADTAALREAAAEELKAYFEDTDAYLAEGRRDFADRELRWASLAEARGDQGSVPTRQSRPAPSRYRAGVSLPPPPPFKRVVLSWRTDPAVRFDSLPVTKWPQRGLFGITLSQPRSRWRLAVGAEHARLRDQELPLSGPEGSVRVTEARGLSAYGLLAVPRQLVPVYAGYRSWEYTLHPPGLEKGLERNDRALVLGLGFPPFTELAEGALRNAYLEAGLWPKLLSLDAGTRFRVADLPGASLNGVLGVSLGFSNLSDAEALGVTGPFGEGDVYLDRFGTETGLELSFGNAAGVFALWEYEASELNLLPEADGGEYDLLFGSTRSLSEEADRSSLSVGLRLSL